jgi:hypothetical protein
MNATEQKLDELAHIRGEMAAIKNGFLEKYRQVLGDEIYQRIVNINQELDAYYLDLKERSEKLESEIKSMALKQQKGFTGRLLQVVWSRPAYKWDRDLLEFEMEKDKVFAKRIKRFFTVGNPVVSIRGVGNNDATL